MFLLLGLAASTLLSEDAACLAAAALIRRGQISTAEGVAACAIGIYAGDCLLWLTGRLMRHSRVTFRAGMVDSPAMLLASRFLPGTRLPLYLAAGAVGTKPRAFFLWTLIAGLLWTPAIVLGSASSIVGGLIALALFHASRFIHWRRLRQRVSATMARWRRWEFWPSTILYAPVALHIIRLAIRHGGLTTFSAANPGISEGGFVGESKFQILSQLPEAWTIPAVFVAAGSHEDRLTDIRSAVDARGWNFPLVVKPDAGQRGTGVRRVRTWEEVSAYLCDQRADVLVQPYHAGPFEAGIFYYRYPDADRGRIFSVTDKVFPVLIGDGQSSFEELIWRHPRYRLQANVFLTRYRDMHEYVLGERERLSLAIAGNHAQGTLFRDGAHLVTRELETRIDAIARHVPGFYIGRFDVRYTDVEAFRRGEDLAIVELNGVTSESTNIYDPSFTLFSAWCVLCRQWTLVFEIGARNRELGHAPASLRRLLTLSLQHLRQTPVLPLAS
jgi:membrane protein DedA with SNARE-associated domain